MLPYSGFRHVFQVRLLSATRNYAWLLAPGWRNRLKPEIRAALAAAASKGRGVSLSRSRRFRTQP